MFVLVGPRKFVLIEHLFSSDVCPSDVCSLNVCWCTEESVLSDLIFVFVSAKEYTALYTRLGLNKTLILYTGSTYMYIHF